MEKYNVTIKKIEWFDKDNPEANVLFEIEKKEYWAFCHPCNFIDGEEVSVNFNFIEDEISEFSFWNENKNHTTEIIASLSDKTRYYCYGQLRNSSPKTINCGPISFDWVIENKDPKLMTYYVYFVVARLDISKA